MKIEFQNTRRDYLNYYKILLKKRFERWLIGVLIIFVVVLGIFAKLQVTPWIYLLVTVAYAIMVYCFFYLFLILKYALKLDKLIAKDPAIIEKLKLIVTDDGLKSEWDNGSSLRSWESITSVSSNEKFVNINLVDKKTITIAKGSFLSDIATADFIGAIRAKIINNRGTEQRYQNPTSMYSLKPKPPYWAGLLGFIPIIGAFAGVVFIINGIFKYKDRWLVSIGVGCILFTIFFFWWQKYSITNNPNFKKAMVHNSQIQMDKLVKDIEFYKIQHGDYPDSLAQMDIKNEFIDIYDPISSNMSTPFNYHKIGNKYTLFSSGVDQIPNTADDIYPQVDTSKIGLIIKK